MTKKSITKNYIYNLSYQILTIVVPLITTPYLSRTLGAENIGIHSYTLSITTYFILFGSLGVAMYGQREIAYLQENKTERSKTFFEILFMRAITMGIALITFFFTFTINGQYKMYYKILIFEIVSNIIDISWYFQGIEEFKKTVVRNSIVKIVGVFCIFLFVKTRDDLISYFLIYVLSTLLGNLSLWAYLPKYIEKVSMKKLNIFRHLKPTLGLFIPQIAMQIYTVLDKTMIGIIIDDKSEVGFYEQAQKIVKVTLTIATSLGTVMVPRMANTFANGDKIKLKEYMIRSFNFVLLLVYPLLLGMISIAKKFVPIFYGNGYDIVVYLIIIISPILLAIGISNVIGTQYLLPTKQQKKFTISVTGGAFINFIINLFFIPIFKSLGASISTVIAEFVVTGIQLYYIRDIIKIKDLIRISKNYALPAVIMFIFSVGISFIIKDNVISILVQISLSAIVYFAVLVVMKDTFFSQVTKIISNKLHKKI